MMDGLGSPETGLGTLQKPNENFLADERLYHLALSLTGAIVALLDIPQRGLIPVYFEEGTAKIMSSSEGIPQSMIDVEKVHVDDVSVWEAFFNQIYAGSPEGATTLRIFDARGNWLIHEIRAATIFSETGEPEYAVLTMSDVTLRKRTEEVYGQYYKAVTRDANYVGEFDLEQGVLLNGHVQDEAVFDWGGARDYAESLTLVGKSVPDGYRQRFKFLFGREHLLDEFYAANLEVRFDHPICFKNAKDLAWVQSSAHMILAPDGAIHAIICMRDITNRDKVKEIVDREKECDPLSGLLSGKTFRQKVADVLKNDRRIKEGYLFVIDIDNFDEINGEHGKTYGDEVIRSVADVLKECFRSEDLLGRVGCNELMAFVSNIDAECVRGRASEIAKNLGRIKHDQKADIEVMLSIGIAEARTYDGYESLHNRAHKALYHAKSNEEGSWSLWE